MYTNASGFPAGCLAVLLATVLFLLTMKVKSAIVVAVGGELMEPDLFLSECPAAAAAIAEVVAKAVRIKQEEREQQRGQELGAATLNNVQGAKGAR